MSAPAVNSSTGPTACPLPHARHLIFAPLRIRVAERQIPLMLPSDTGSGLIRYTARTSIYGTVGTAVAQSITGIACACTNLIDEFMLCTSGAENQCWATNYLKHRGVKKKACIWALLHMGRSSAPPWQQPGHSLAARDADDMRLGRLPVTRPRSRLLKTTSTPVPRLTRRLPRSPSFVLFTATMRATAPGSGASTPHAKRGRRGTT